jgi:hypothetical protein
VLRNYAGKTYVYKQPHEAGAPDPIPLEFEPVFVG